MVISIAFIVGVSIVCRLTKAHREGMIVREEDAVLLWVSSTGDPLQVSRAATAYQFHDGPVEYIDVTVADNKPLTCLKRGLYFFDTKRGPLVMLQYDSERMTSGIVVEVMAREREHAECFLHDLFRTTRQSKAFIRS